MRNFTAIDMGTAAQVGKNNENLELCISFIVDHMVRIWNNDNVEDLISCVVRIFIWKYPRSSFIYPFLNQRIIYGYFFWDECIFWTFKLFILKRLSIYYYLNSELIKMDVKNLIEALSFLFLYVCDYFWEIIPFSPPGGKVL